MIRIIRITELTGADYQTISGIWEDSGVGNPARGDTLDAVNRTLSHGAVILLALSGDKPAGTAWLTHDHRRLYIHHMGVLSIYRNMGIGRRLLDESLLIARELRLQAKLEVHQDNPSALHLYQSSGFATLDGYITLINRDTGK